MNKRNKKYKVGHLFKYCVKTVNFLIDYSVLNHIVHVNEITI